VSESQRIGLFRHAPDARSYASGETIFAEGEAADVMYVIQAGEVEIFHHGVLVETLDEGNIFGEMSLISDEARAATAVAKGDTRLVPIDLRRFMFLVEETPYFAVQVMKVLAARVRKMLPRLEAGAERPAAT
jgi:CRP-like cAMP-binding protein